VDESILKKIYLFFLLAQKLSETTKDALDQAKVGGDCSKLEM
jgi:hypothetical protein